MANPTLHIALAGNPNCGKTTLFNLITGANGYVGNWPGVTVEKKEAPLSRDTRCRPTAPRSACRAITS